MRLLAIVAIAFAFGGSTVMAASGMNSSGYAVDAAVTTNGGGSSFSASYAAVGMVRHDGAAIGKSAVYALSGDVAVFGTPKGGNCGGAVTVAGLQSAVNMFLAAAPISNCVDLNGDNQVSVAEVQRVIGTFLRP